MSRYRQELDTYAEQTETTEQDMALARARWDATRLERVNRRPRADELLVSVRDFLRGDVMAETSGRTQFLSRVAGNSLDIVLRDQRLGAEHRRRELARLNQLLGSEDALLEQRWALVHALRERSMALDNPELGEHLRTTVVNQIAIDQPKYSGFRTAQGQLED